MKELTEKGRVNAIFRDLRKMGYTAKQNFSCCTSCANYEIHTELENLGIPEDQRKTFFYSRQSRNIFSGHNFNGRFENDAEGNSKHVSTILYANWSGDAQEIISVIEKHGLKAVWKGTDADCIGITI